MPKNDTGPSEQDVMFEMFEEIFDEDRVADRLLIPDDLKDVVEKYERNYILEALEQYEYNQTKASRRLGIKRTTLIAKMKKFKIVH